MKLSSPTEEMSRVAVRASAVSVVLVLYLGSLLSFGDRVIFGMVIKPLKESLNFTSTEIGLLAGAAFALSYAFFSPVAGWAVDRFSRRVVFGGAIGFWSLMTLFSGLASDFTTMALARIGLGVGEAFLTPLAVSLISDAIAPDRRARIIAIYASSSAMGIFVALLAGGTLIGELSGTGSITLPMVGPIEPWRGLFVAAALPGFVLAASVLAFLREPPRTSAGTVIDLVGEKAQVNDFLKRYWHLILSIYVGGCTIQLAGNSWITWQVPYFEGFYGWSGAKASIVLAFTSGIAAVAGCFSTGALVQFLKRRGHRDASLRAIVIGGVSCNAFLIAALFLPSAEATVACLCVSMFWLYFPIAGMFNVMSEAFPASVRGRLAGLQVLAVGIVTNSVGQLLVGFLSDRYSGDGGGLRTAMIITTFVSLFVGVAVLVPGFRVYRRLMSEQLNAVRLSSLADGV